MVECIAGGSALLLLLQHFYSMLELGGVRVVNSNWNPVSASSTEAFSVAVLYSSCHEAGGKACGDDY